MNSLTISELVLATKGRLISGNENDRINDVIIDSRSANKENIFVAIVGESLDGHEFIKSAYENGCRNFIKNESSSIKLDSSDINLIEVKDTEIAMGDIGKYYKSKFNIPYIGITGSVGKTTTRDMIYATVSAKFNTLKNEGNLNNQLGVPLTLFNLNESHECGVIEMGMSGFDEIKYLANIVNPQIGVISNIGLSHIENLGSQEGILKAKMEITSNFDSSSTLIVNGDDKFLSTLKNKNHEYKLKTFGFNKDNDIYCSSYDMNEESITFECMINNKKEEIFIPTVGEHNIYNAMGAILVGDHHQKGAGKQDQQGRRHPDAPRPQRGHRRHAHHQSDHQGRDQRKGHAHPLRNPEQEGIGHFLKVHGRSLPNVPWQSVDSLRARGPPAAPAPP